MCVLNMSTSINAEQYIFCRAKKPRHILLISVFYLSKELSIDLLIGVFLSLCKDQQTDKDPRSKISCQSPVIISLFWFLYEVWLKYYFSNPFLCINFIILYIYTWIFLCADLTPKTRHTNSRRLQRYIHNTLQKHVTYNENTGTAPSFYFLLFVLLYVLYLYKVLWHVVCGSKHPSLFESRRPRN